MFRKYNSVLIFSFIFLICRLSSGQDSDSGSFKLISRLNFYSNEKYGEMLLHIPPLLMYKNLIIKLFSDENVLSEWTGNPGREILRLPFDINPAQRSSEIKAEIIVSGRGDEISGKKYYTIGDMTILTHKTNEVKTDRLTGGLIVNSRQFFPFGFYCYSPVYPTLPEEETVNGFNMISPYQEIRPETLTERKAYMDRCAQLGMKVHYNLLSVAGGGGAISRKDSLTSDQRRELLINEIKTFMDHPALLGWYISDEPTGNGISPEFLKEIYRIVKKTDPWHPVSIVFTAPFSTAIKFSDAVDIVMADPYPVPDRPVSVVGDVTHQLKGEFGCEKPLWIVPQAFGGGELWNREPTPQEIRSMTWQALIRGATGIQYFVRHGLNSFPKSTVTWSECSRTALEVAELTPWLLSEEETIPVESGSRDILISSHLHNRQLIIMIVNKVNEPRKAEIRITRSLRGNAKVLFENRSVPVSDGYFSDQIQAFGSQVYMINLNSGNDTKSTIIRNLIKDPGFEDQSSPGIPASCYALSGGDRGATYFLDPREHYEGNHSLRIITPVENKSISLKFFPFSVKAGFSYSISIFSKSDPEQRLKMWPLHQDSQINKDIQDPQYVEISLGGFGKARFIPDGEWRRYITFITIPEDTLPSIKINLTIRMPGQGVAWFDKLSVTEDK